MPQLDNDDIIERILISVIDVIGRRTSEEYAVVIINKVIKKLKEKHDFFEHVDIKSTQYSEYADVIDIKSDINYVDPKDMGEAIKEFVENLTLSIGTTAGYYFIKEVEEELPHEYELKIKELGVDLGLMQLEYITSKKNMYMLQIENSELLKHVLKTLFDILDSDIGRNFAVTTIRDLIERFSKEYKILKYVKINDTRFIQGVDTVSVIADADYTKSKELSHAIQKIIQELDDTLKEKCGSSVIERLRNNLSTEYAFKLEEMGVNLKDIQLRQDFVVRHVLKALIDVLSEISTQSYAVLVIDKVLRRIDDEYGYLKYVKINSMRYSDGINAVNILSDINSADPYELGRAIQKFIEKMAIAFGEEAGRHFIDKFKERLSETYLNRIEEMGVNLHMIQLRQNIFF